MIRKLKGKTKEEVTKNYDEARQTLEDVKAANLQRVEELHLKHVRELYQEYQDELNELGLKEKLTSPIKELEDLKRLEELEELTKLDETLSPTE